MSQTSTRTRKITKEKRPGIVLRLWDMSIGNVFRFVGWSILAVFVSILVEWIGMVFWWDLDHSEKILTTEFAYLSQFNRNLIIGIYPKDLAHTLLEYCTSFVQYIHLTHLADRMKESTWSVLNAIAHGLQAAVNVAFLFCVRLAICVSAMTGFIVATILGVLDGLTEREIRKDCGGNESALVYHHAKRFIGPSMFLAFGIYLTFPVSIHPLVIFLPAFFVTGLTFYITASRFKKFL
ncbi:MAG: TIGR03747 family integrating conjugative element membrane protein [Cellvibrionaceae bacterium]|nr:TIGR03747 family integrating conjugative element membrane protein [Cellvibrionaceae bacterium]